mgnify:CR=1 FL=1
MTKDRGFKKLKDVFISRVDAKCVNQVVLWDDDKFHAYVIDVEMQNDIPVLTCTRMDEEEFKKLRKPKKEPKK